MVSEQAHDFLSNPLFDFFFQFDIFPEKAKATAAEQREFLSDRFKLFLKKRRRKQTALGRRMEAALEGFPRRSTLGRFTERFDDYYEFILQLPNPAMNEKRLESLFSRARRVIRHALKGKGLRGIQSTCTGLSHQLLVAVYKARAEDPEYVTRATQRFQTQVDSFLRVNLSRFSAKRASRVLQLCITLAALAFAFGAFAKGISSHLTTQMLLLRRKVSASDWTDLDQEVRFRHALFCLHALIQAFGATGPVEPKLGFSQNTILDFRRCMTDGLTALRGLHSSIFTSVFQSQLDRINEGVFYVWVPLQLTAEQLSPEEQRRVTALAARFSSYRHPIGIENLLRFLSQFASLSEMRLALRVLEQVKYYSLKQLQAMLESAVECIPSQFGRPGLVLPLGSIQGSTSLMNYLAGHWKLGQPEFRTDLEEVLRSSDPSIPLWFFDDCCFSGTQTLDIFGDLLGTRRRKPHHTKHANVLSHPDQFRARPIRLVYAIVSSGALEVPQRLGELGFPDVKLFASSVENLREKIFTASMIHLWDDPKDMQDTRDAFFRIGREILGRRAEEKNWPQERTSASALGFEDYQRLVVFQYNVPKCTLTALWERGPYQSREWVPLFASND